MKKLLAATLVAGVTLTSAGAFAEDFPATPINHGAPTNLPGETIIPGMTQAMQIVNGVTQPILQPILAPGGGPAPAAEPMPMMRRHRSHRMMMRHRMMRHHIMMKHKMMAKKEMMQKGM